MFSFSPRFIFLVFVALLGLLTAAASVFIHLAGAVEASLTGSQLTVTYTEPSTNQNGAPLADLKETRLYIQLDGDAPQLAQTLPASQLTGGGSISAVVVVPVGAADEADVRVWATAADLVGNESEPSPSRTVRIDRLAPAAPR